MKGGNTGNVSDAGNKSIH